MSITESNATPQSETDSLVLLETKGDYGVVTLNRPDKRNAMSRDAIRRLWQVLDETAELGLRAIVLTGAGASAFCAGADIKDTSPIIPTSARWISAWHRTQDIIRKHPAVFIAAVNGFALGGGLTLVNNAELAVASTKATFGMPEITFGAYAALAGPSTIHRLMPKHAADLLFTGRRIDAEQALAWGMVNQVVEPDKLLPTACELAERISGFDGAALQIAKEALHSEREMGWDAAMDHGSRTTAQLPVLREAWAKA
jgi:enoyl-CoA hydratase/carnithine racemase